MRTLGTNQIENQICEAIELIVNKAVASAGYDRTIRASVVSCVDQSIGKYKVKYQDNIFFAYTENVDVKYSKGTEVYVLIHNNDLNMNKTILGSVKKLGADYITAVSPENKYEKIGTSLISNSNNFELCSFILEDKRDVDSDLVFLKDNEIKEYISKSSHIIIEADIKTALPQSQRYKGNYGITFDIDFYASEAEKNSSTPEIVTKTYKLDINNITGEPYALNEFTKQFAVFKITPETFKEVKNISIFEYGFPEQKANQPNDIFIKNISMYAAVEVPEQDLLSCYLSIVTLEGTYFDEQNSETDEKFMKAQVVVKGNVVEDNSQIKYYWFRENAKVSSIDLTKFNKYGGNGWECLNKPNILTSDEQGDPLAIEWIPGSDEFKLRKDEILTTEVKYKCVALYGNVILSKEIVFKNTDSLHRISIVSDSGTMFFEGVGEPTLTCLIDEQENTKDYTYYWIVLDNNNLLSEVAANNNKVEKINMKTIMTFATYKCSVYLATNGSYLGTSSITLTNGEVMEENEYTFILNNGVQVFKYDEDGVAPTSTIMDNPQVIYPLSFTTYDSAGMLIPAEEVCASGSVKWIVPFEDESLIVMPDGYADGTVTEEGFVFKGYPELNYEIAKRFNSTKIKNNIKLSIEYDGFIYNAETSFSFLKEGDPGTNGTSYYCRIVPNTIEGEEVAYPMITYDQTTESYNLNYSRPVGQTDRWFKVQLWENDNKIFENDEDGAVSDKEPYAIEWSIPLNTYASNIHDLSDLFIKRDENDNNKYLGFGFDKKDDQNDNVVNIVKCKVTYNQQVFYATMPIITATVLNNNYKIDLKKGTGFSFVKYASDGTSPRYNGSNLFEIELFENDVDITQNEAIEEYKWNVIGKLYRDNEWQPMNHLSIPAYSNQNVANWERTIRPNEPYNGECLSNAIECVVIRDGISIAALHIPIHMYLNRYGFANLNDWDGNHIDINNTGNYILAPQIGAGIKENNNTFTGIVMGEVKESGGNNSVGLLGYSQGVRSIFLDAETGGAEFGTTARIIIDPMTDTGDSTARIYSDSYDGTTDKGGLLIDFGRNPLIEFGSKNFKVDSNGHMTAKGGGHIAGWEITDELLEGEDVGLRSTAPKDKNGNKDKSADAIWAGTKFSVDFEGNLYAVDANISGNIQATKGYIGNWYIYNGKLVGDPEYDEDGELVDYSIKLNADTSRGNAIEIGDDFTVSADGMLTASSGKIGGWTISSNQLKSKNKMTVLRGDTGKIDTNTIDINYIVEEDDEEIAVALGKIGHLAGKTVINGVEIGTNNLGISTTNSDYGIILESASHIGIKASQGIWLNATGVYFNGEDITIARFG